jgi:hypothetical protein
MLTLRPHAGDDGDVSSVNTMTTVGRTLVRPGCATGAARLPRQIGFTKRRVIDLMRVGRTFCRR